MVPVTAGVILDDRGRVLLAQRPGREGESGQWEFPGGKLRDGETPEQCLRRELKEELGMSVEVGDVFHVVHHPYPEGSILLVAYLCRFRGRRIRLLEHMAYRWLDPTETPTMDLMEADRPIAMKLVERFTATKEASGD
jgi:8-oxo-dGTP diphosphatase